ncbi:L-lactate permease, partial [Escherichia coli]
WSTSKTPSYTKSVSWQHHLFIAAIISIFVLGVGIKKGIGVFAETLISLKWPILSIGMVLAFAFVTNYSGMSTTLALVLAGTGVMFP